MLKRIFKLLHEIRIAIYVFMQKQVFIRHLYRFIRGREDYYEIIKRKRLFNVRTKLYFFSNKKISNPKRILFNSPFIWNYEAVNFSLATSLKLRGHNVQMIACGGINLFCKLFRKKELQTSGNFCKSCLDWTINYFKAYDLPYIIAKNYLSTEDFLEAKQLSEFKDLNSLSNFEFMNINIGKIARISLFQYYKGDPFNIDYEKEKTFRCAIESLVLIVKIAYRIIEEYNPDIIVSTNGKTLYWAPFIEVAKLKGIDYITWEDLCLKKYGLILEKNGIAHEQRVDKIWKQEREQPLLSEDKKRVITHFEDWKKKSLLNKDTKIETNFLKIKNQLNLINENRPLVSIFTNVLWDCTSIGFDKAFLGMFDWVFSVVEYAKNNPNMDFVIRAHPGETKIPEKMYRCSTPVCEEILKRYSPLPKNIKLLDSHSSISSYTLGLMSNVVMVYTSTLGLEFALLGKRPWVAADAYYSNKGFTVDLKSKEHMHQLLNDGVFENNLNKDQIELAERFAYLVRHKRIFPLPFFNKKGIFVPPSFNVFLPGGNKIFDRLCDCILTDKFFILEE